VVIEVSDTTLSYDKNAKLPIYARAGLPEAWIVDLGGRKVEVHADPCPEGYRGPRSFRAGERVVSSTVEGLSVAVDEVLG
jgi:Uma2 family endonuclease